MEDRIKEDISQEMKNQHGMIICHDEVLTLPSSTPPPPPPSTRQEEEKEKEEEEGEKKEGAKEGQQEKKEEGHGGNFLTPVWTYPFELLTSSEAWDSFQEEGYNMKYCRVPMSSGEIPTLGLSFISNASFMKIFIWRKSKKYPFEIVSKIKFNLLLRHRIL